MRTIYEIIVDFLPGLRSAIARELISAYGMSQAQVAEIMAVSQPAVSQYLNAVRGKNDEPWMKSPEFEKILKESCEKLASKKISITEELPIMVRRLRMEKVVCPSCELKDKFCDHCKEI